MKPVNKDIVFDILDVINTRTPSIGEGSIADIIKACEFIYPDFNRAFSAGYGAKFDETGKLIDVDGFGLFKRLKYQTSFFVYDYLLQVDGSLEIDTYMISFVRRNGVYEMSDNLPETPNWNNTRFSADLKHARDKGYVVIKTPDGCIYDINSEDSVTEFKKGNE